MATYTVTLNPNPAQRGRQAVFTVVWDEVVTGFTLSDTEIFLNNQSFDGAVTFVAVSGTTYTFTFVVPATTPLMANVFFRILASSVDQGNLADILIFERVVDPPPGVSPTIAFRQARYDAGDTAIADITLDSSDVTLIQSHLTATGGAAITSFSGSGTAYVVNISVPSTPEDGIVGLSIAEIEIGDDTLLAGSATVPYYTDATVTVTLPDGPVDAGTTQTGTIVYNKVVAGMVIGDLSVNMGTLQNFRTTDNITFMVDIVVPSTGAGDITLSLAADAVVAGNAATSDTMAYLTRGVAAITIDPTFALHESTVTATIVWNQSVDDFISSEVEVRIGGVLQTTGVTFSGSGDTYTVSVTAPDTGSGDIEFKVLENVISEGNGEISQSTNYGPITPQLSAVGTQFFAGVIFTVEITTQADVTGLDMEDVFVVGGTIDAFREISGSEYEVDISPPDSGMGLIEITIGADAVNEGNDASSTLGVNYTDDPNAPIIGVVSLVSIPVFLDTETEQEDRDTFEVEIPISGNPDKVVVKGLQDSFYYDWESGDDICYVRGRPRRLVKERIWDVMATKELSNRDIERQRTIMYEVVSRAPVIDKTIGRQIVFQGGVFNLLIPVANSPSTATVISPILGTVSDIGDEGVIIRGDIPFDANFTIDESMFELEVSNDAGMDSHNVPFDISDDNATLIYILTSERIMQGNTVIETRGRLYLLNGDVRDNETVSVVRSMSFIFPDEIDGHTFPRSANHSISRIGNNGTNLYFTVRHSDNNASVDRTRFYSIDLAFDSGQTVVLSNSLAISEAREITSLPIQGVALDERGRLYATDYRHGQLAVWDDLQGGNRDRNWNFNVGQGFFSTARPRGIVVDDTNLVFHESFYGHALYFFDRDFIPVPPASTHYTPDKRVLFPNLITDENGNTLTIDDDDIIDLSLNNDLLHMLYLKNEEYGMIIGDYNIDDDERIEVGKLIKLPDDILGTIRGMTIFKF